MKIKEAKANTYDLLFNGPGATFRLTKRCNNNCPHCYLNLPLAEKVKELSVKNWEAIIDELIKNGFTYLTLIGGEITAYSGFEEVYLYAKKSGLLVQLMSNLAYFEEKTKLMFEKYPPSKVVATIYGVDAKTYTTVTGNKKGWKEFLKNAKFFSKLQKTKGTKFVLVSIYTKDTIKFCKKINEFGLKYTGKKPEYTKILFSRLDGNSVRNKMIQEKRLKREEQENLLLNARDGGDFFPERIPEAKNCIREELFPCSVGKVEDMTFFEDGTMTQCCLISDEKYALKLSEKEIENFDYKKMREKFKKKVASFASLKINPKCGSCTLRYKCYSCPARNLLKGIPETGHDKELCLKEILEKKGKSD